MYLSNLIKDFFTVPNSADRLITGLSLNSRHIQKGNLFVAMKGHQVDGSDFIDDAIKRGASCVIKEGGELPCLLSWQGDVPIISFSFLKLHLSTLASRFYNFPEKDLHLFGVTGTSGKTSCSHFIAQILTSIQIPCGLIGTLGAGFYPDLQPIGLTTPDSITIHSALANLKQQGAKAVAMEVSSHSLDQERVRNLNFDVGIFTNLSQDHLDYHHTMEDYAKVKKRFFTERSQKNNIINADDAYGFEWLGELDPQTIFAYSLKAPKKFTKLRWIFVDHIKKWPEGLEAKIHSPWGSVLLYLPLLGEFNLSNALAVFTALNIYGVPFDKITEAFSTLQSVPGRMQKLKKPGQPLVVVDYAHKPDALEKVLMTLRQHIKGELICIFGCGGNRDIGKRPQMAAIAERLADKVIVTQDNPRHEDPSQIIQDICKGFSKSNSSTVIEDRSQAIKQGIQFARQKMPFEENCVLIAGKGAETYQQIQDRKIPFDDLKEAQLYLEENN